VIAAPGESNSGAHRTTQPLSVSRRQRFSRYAHPRVTGIRVTVTRKSHNLDARLLSRARKALGARTETDTIHEALRAVLIGERLLRDIDTLRGKDGRAGRRLFRPEFVRAMRAESRRRT
jgi:hypothetical protein